MLVVAAGASALGAGCSCGDRNCGSSGVYVDLGVHSGADAAEVCVDGSCAMAVADASFGGGWVRLDLDRSPTEVAGDDRVDLTINVLDEERSVLGSVDDSRDLDPPGCGCASFSYRWTGAEVTRHD